MIHTHIHNICMCSLIRGSRLSLAACHEESKPSFPLPVTALTVQRPQLSATLSECLAASRDCKCAITHIMPPTHAQT